VGGGVGGGGGGGCGLFLCGFLDGVLFFFFFAFADVL